MQGQAVIAVLATAAVPVIAPLVAILWLATLWNVAIVAIAIRVEFAGDPERNAVALAT